MIFGPAYHQRFESVLTGDAAEECPELWLHLRRDQIAALFGGEDTMDQFRDVGVGHGRLRGEGSAVPIGTEFQHPPSYPALKRRVLSIVLRTLSVSQNGPRGSEGGGAVPKGECNINGWKGNQSGGGALRPKNA